MKVRSVRLNDPFAERYSGVFHNEGEMVTASDLNDHGLIAAARTDALGDDTIKDGVPFIGGMLTWNKVPTNLYPPANITGFCEGVVYADGVRGSLKVRTDPATGLPDKYVPGYDLFEKQADFPLGPSWPIADEHLVYADIWTADVFPCEEPHMSDPALHGAETSLRGRTMVQLKTARVESPTVPRTEIDTGTGRFPRIGTATIAAKPAATIGQDDPCDPCADVVKVDQRIPNALFRIEIVRVEGDANKPSKIAVAWSIENASIILAASRKADLARTGCVYQYCSNITESRRGVFAGIGDLKTSAFSDNLAATPTPATDYNGKDWPYVRRWNGYAVIDMAAGTSTKLGADKFAFAAGKITVTCDAVEATLDCNNKSFVTGDYWLVELRTFAPTADKVRALRPEPFGILHHYCVLAVVKNNVFTVPSDADRRKLSFPTLSDIPAADIGFTDNCPKLFEGAKNVQQALDNLCHITADDIGFQDSCPFFVGVTNVAQALHKLCDISAKDIKFEDNCDLFKGAETVQDALEKLCDLEFSSAPDYRLLFDWGVLCGLKIRQVAGSDGRYNSIQVDGGAFLDRSGRISEATGTVIAMNDPSTYIRHPFWKTDRDFYASLAIGGVCVAVARDGNERKSVKYYLVPDSLAFGPADPAYQERVDACVANTVRFRWEDLVADLSPDLNATANTMLNTVRNWDTVSQYVEMDAATHKRAMDLNDSLAMEYRKVASPNDVKTLDQRVQYIKQKYTGIALSDSVRAQYASEYFGVVLETEEERRERCECENYYPPCPPELGDAPYFVPLGCVHGIHDDPTTMIYQVCVYCCRKQALTPRTINYWFKPYRDAIDGALNMQCCQPPAGVKGPNGTITDYEPGRRFNYRAEDWSVDGGLFAGKRASIVAPLQNFRDIPVNDAQTKVSDAGYALAGFVDVNDRTEMTKLLSSGIAVGAGESIALQPGDSITLLKQGDVVVGQVVNKRAVPGVASGAKIDEAALAGMQAKIAEASSARAQIEKDIDGANATLAATKADIVKAQSDITALNAARGQAKTDLDAMQSQYKEVTANIAKSQTDLKTLAGAVRGAMPVSSLDIDPVAARTLAAAGVGTVSDLANLPDDKAKALTTSAGIKTADLVKFRSVAGNRIKNP